MRGSYSYANPLHSCYRSAIIPGMNEKEDNQADKYDWRIVAIPFSTAIVLGGLGFTFGYTNLWIWLTKEMSEGFGALTAGLIGFSGLIFVAFWSGRQTKDALVLSAKHDRELEEDRQEENRTLEKERHEEAKALEERKRTQIATENSSIVIGTVGICDDVFREMDNRLVVLFDSPTEDNAIVTINQLRTVYLNHGFLDSPVFAKKPEFLRGIGEKATKECYVVAALVVAIGAVFSMATKTEIDKAELLMEGVTAGRGAISALLETLRE